MSDPNQKLAPSACYSYRREFRALKPEKRERLLREWQEARKPVWDAFERDTADEWAKVIRGECTAEQYRIAIDPILTRTLNNLEPIWRAHGGAKNPPRKTIQQAQEEWDAKWSPDSPPPT